MKSKTNHCQKKESIAKSTSTNNDIGSGSELSRLVIGKPATTAAANSSTVRQRLRDSDNRCHSHSGKTVVLNQNSGPRKNFFNQIQKKDLNSKTLNQIQFQNQTGHKLQVKSNFKSNLNGHRPVSGKTVTIKLDLGPRLPPYDPLMDAIRTIRYAQLRRKNKLARTGTEPYLPLPSGKTVSVTAAAAAQDSDLISKSAKSKTKIQKSKTKIKFDSHIDLVEGPTANCHSNLKSSSKFKLQQQSHSDVSDSKLQQSGTGQAAAAAAADKSESDGDSNNDSEIEFDSDYHSEPESKAFNAHDSDSDSALTEYYFDALGSDSEAEAEVQSDGAAAGLRLSNHQLSESDSDSLKLKASVTPNADLSNPISYHNQCHNLTNQTPSLGSIDYHGIFYNVNNSGLNGNQSYSTSRSQKQSLPKHIELNRPSTSVSGVGVPPTANSNSTPKLKLKESLGLEIQNQNQHLLVTPDNSDISQHIVGRAKAEAAQATNTKPQAPPPAFNTEKFWRSSRGKQFKERLRTEFLMDAANNSENALIPELDWALALAFHRLGLGREVLVEGLEGLQKVQQTDDKVQQTDDKVHQTDDKVHQTDDHTGSTLTKPKPLSPKTKSQTWRIVSQASMEASVGKFKDDHDIDFKLNSDSESKLIDKS